MLKIKRAQNSLRITNEGDIATMPLNTLAEANLAIDTMAKAVSEITHQNELLQKSVLHNEESYDTKSIDNVFEDATKNLSSIICKNIKKGVATSPYHLQGQQVKATLGAVSITYEEIANMLLASSGADTLSLAKSLLAKAQHVKHDVALVEDYLDAPLNSIKRFKAEKELREELLTKGAMREQAKLGTVNQEVINLAKTIGNARKLTADIENRKDEAVANAKRAARSL
jgi:hypothetical protein